jgi:predicted exporter
MGRCGVAAPVDALSSHARHAVRRTKAARKAKRILRRPRVIMVAGSMVLHEMAWDAQANATM